MIINGKELAKQIRSDLKKEAEALREDGIIPKLAVIMVGNDKASEVYVRNKSKACNEVGIEFEEFLKDGNTKQEELIGWLLLARKEGNVNGR